MSHITELHPHESVLRLQSSGYEGIVQNDPGDEYGDLFVSIPELGVERDFGPCTWNARALTTGLQIPTRGDIALVVFTTENDPWVVMWRPA